MTRKTGTHERPHTPLWEVVAGLAGLIILGAGTVYLIFTALRGADAPPEISFQIQETHALRENYHVKMEAQNNGSTSVSGLLIEGTLRSSDGEVQVSEAEVDYLPSNSARLFGLFFDSDPNAGELEVRALGYQEP